MKRDILGDILAMVGYIILSAVGCLFVGLTIGFAINYLTSWMGWFAAVPVILVVAIGIAALFGLCELLSLLILGKRPCKGCLK